MCFSPGTLTDIDRPAVWSTASLVFRSSRLPSRRLLAVSWSGTNSSAFTFYCSFLIAAAVYPTVIVTLQFFASCRLPLALRLSLVYAALFACLRALAFGVRAPVEGPVILCCAPICIGGLLQHRLGGWSALALGAKSRTARQESRSQPCLDLTAAAAITMGIASTTEIDPSSLSVLILPWLIMAAVGMHGWGRLTSLCDERTHRDMGFAIWMVGNAIWACGDFSNHGVGRFRIPCGAIGVCDRSAGGVGRSPGHRDPDCLAESMRLEIRARAMLTPTTALKPGERSVLRSEYSASACRRRSPCQAVRRCNRKSTPVKILPM